jgi:hypothetical protein
VSDHLLRAGIRVAPVESRLKDAMPQQNALVWEGGTVVAVRPVTVPEAPPDWVAVNIAYAGICGSDLHIAPGKHIPAQPSRSLGMSSSASWPSLTVICRWASPSSSLQWWVSSEVMNDGHR